jgi:antitoxin StbD
MLLAQKYRKGLDKQLGSPDKDSHIKLQLKYPLKCHKQVLIMLTKIHADLTVSISELKRNPQAIIDDARGEAIALLNRNKPTAYIIPVDTYEALMELAEDIELGQIIELRKPEKKDAVEVDLDAL